MKNKFLFHVVLNLNSLSSIPFVSGVVFCKIKLTDGGKFRELSTRQNIRDHATNWEERFEFDCATVANKQGLLASRMVKISVRKERQGGKSFEKLGYVQVDLAEFAGAGSTVRRYILNAHNSATQRQDNSILTITMALTLKSGDPLFKAPRPPDHAFSNPTMAGLINDNISEKSGDTLPRAAGAPIAAALAEVHALERLGHVRTPSDDLVPAQIEKSRRDARAVVDDIFNSLITDAADEIDYDPDAQPALNLYVSNDGTASLSNRRGDGR
ncbi:hypothetical protein CAOG_08428 [Capsaspora owczarzaki ATCC 30864]|uniref:C2 NT-type domain-containing protein n=1 Tax=Capsaspora owczarzaki (strain ATCC 30864) TaxID=595528 RepID=A0A0D2X0G9_CAPO3|nr:hypothetical protein CAOG_08428 [Capsaspora owczarzaki ATCC 30864]KJE89039.1 hypothetical protein CAOG_008428 [Capsaspora owczarzaki ATCC 30864]|eukprot:XP_011269999.1 hypothetical protein CAOG_08428 [Capsaspora owczarzaki ATCC 30864]